MIHSILFLISAVLIWGMPVTITQSVKTEASVRETFPSPDQKWTKEAKAEAKKLRKQGFDVVEGETDLEEQVKSFLEAKYQIDCQGNPSYYLTTTTATAPNYTIARIQALNTAKIEIAGQIHTQVSQKVISSMEQSQAGEEEVTYTDSFLQSSKSTISNALGQVDKFVEVYRMTEKGHVEVLVIVGYDRMKGDKNALKKLLANLDEEHHVLYEELKKLMDE